MNDLAKKHCVPCEGGMPPLSDDKEDKLLKEVSEWELLRKETPHKLRRKFKFKDFKEAMVFVNKVADIAESEDHHPDITINYSRVTLELSTHAVGGLSENDFILAAKINQLNS